MPRTKKKTAAGLPLPPDFQDLAQFMDWAIATEKERMHKRMSSAMPDLRRFYDAMLPRMDAIIAYLNQFPPDSMPSDAQTVFQISVSLIEVANAVELFKQPKLPFGFDPARFVPQE